MLKILRKITPTEAAGYHLENVGWSTSGVTDGHSKERSE
jgi:hypothetical protein